MGNSAEYQQALQNYYLICEDVFDLWKQRSFAVDSLWNGFSTLHCSEPYLMYRDGKCPLLFLTHNPGEPMPFQHIDRLSDDDSIIRKDLSYSFNAKRLVQHYEHPNKINRAASSRIKKMIEFSVRVESDGVLQVELFPLHSAKRPPDKYLFGNDVLPEPFNQYRMAVQKLLDTAPVVVALSGAAPDAKQRSVGNWLRLLRIQNSSPLVLSDEGKNTVGAFVETLSNSKHRILFCSQGNNGVPSPNRWENVIDAIGN